MACSFGTPVARPATLTTAHVVGSNNGMAPWTGATQPNARQVAEVEARNDANIAQLREAFAQAVSLFDGDSHVYNGDKPLATGSTWLALYGVEGAADNLTRVTVDGSSNNTDWLKVQVHRSGPEVMTWEQIPYR